MAKNVIPRDIATVIFAECELARGDTNEGVWEITLTSPMVLIASRDAENLVFNAGTVFYMPFGQMGVWQTKAMELAGRMSDAIALEQVRDAVIADLPTGDQMELPF